MDAPYFFCLMKLEIEIEDEVATSCELLAEVLGASLSSEAILIYALIDMHNQTIADLAANDPQVHHIDCRGVFKNDPQNYQKDWANELHPKMYRHWSPPSGHFWFRPALRLTDDPSLTDFGRPLGPIDLPRVPVSV
jgi:hypothetical protein